MNQFEPFWAKHVHATKLTIVRNRTYRTSVSLALTSNGSLAAIEVDESSGIADLDRAALDAFREAAPFPAPPHELADAGNLVHIDGIGLLLTVRDGKVVQTIETAKFFPGMGDTP